MSGLVEGREEATRATRTTPTGRPTGRFTVSAVLAILLTTGAGCAGRTTDAPADRPDGSAATVAGATCPATLPPLEHVTTAAPGIREDIRYATRDNFTGAPLPGYETPAALLRPGAAAALARVQARLADRGYGLLVWDAYRPLRATLAMVAWAERTGNEWVLEQGYVARRSNHNRGHTVDLTVVDARTGEPLDMGTAYDHFGEASHTANATGAVMANRRVLLDAMAAEGWSNYDQEWWHFTLPGDHEPLDVPIACYAP